MRKNKKNGNLKLILKCLFAIILIYLVFVKIDFKEVIQQIYKSDLKLIFISFLLVLICQALGGLRMRYYLRVLGLPFTKLYSISLYFVGAMLNTLVPGGIGGDGYKAYYFQKKYRFPWTKTVLTVIRGRASGLFFLFLSLIIFSLLYIENIDIKNIEYVLFFLLIILFPTYSFLARKLLNEGLKTQLGGFMYSLPIQLLYVFATIIILTSFGDIENILGYILVFQIANIVAIIPISIGGIGIREYTYILVAGHMGLDLTTGISASLIFYVIYSMTSILGFAPYFMLNKLDRHQKRYLKRYHVNNLF